MNIKLVCGPNKDPLDISIGSARTCYSKNLKTPESISNWDGKLNLAKDLLLSGHHTTLQHVNFTFTMEGVSRLVIWRFFHAHRFYNSDQVSQRYALIDTENYFLDNSCNNIEAIKDLHKNLINSYSKLIDLLEIEYLKSKNKVEIKIARKKAMENARYILPQSIFANLYHTINLSTLIRYHHAAESVSEGGAEIKEIIDSMVNEVITEYPSLAELFQKRTVKNIQFDLFTKPSVPVEIKGLVNSFKQKGDFAYYADTVGSYALFGINEAMNNFSASYEISLTADAQNQRHRTTVGVRPSLLKELTQYNNFDSFLENMYIPSIFHKNEDAMEIFKESMYDIFNVMNNTNISYIPYLLPNAFKITIIESTNMSDFAHKAKMRLCLNAQEEIREITDNMVSALSEKGVNTDFFVPPCVSRFIAGIYPTCSEGDRFCGIKEWKLDKYKHITKL
jgi:flavin-dependent thymidylate synthase